MEGFICQRAEKSSSVRLAPKHQPSIGVVCEDVFGVTKSCMENVNKRRVHRTTQPQNAYAVTLQAQFEVRSEVEIFGREEAGLQAGDLKFLHVPTGRLTSQV
jgi:hypothetical protein